MSKEEYLRIETCVLKVYIHCKGCKHKVRKILKNIDGVYTVNIDSELGKVIISGNVDPSTLIKQLRKNGKYAALWDTPKPDQEKKPNQEQKPNEEQVKDQSKSLQIDDGKGGNGNNPAKGSQNGQKVMGGGSNGAIPNLEQQMKVLQDSMKLPQLNDLKMPMVPPLNNNKGLSQKNAKIDLPEEDDLIAESDDEFGKDEDDDDDDKMDGDDDRDDLPKLKPVIGNEKMPNMTMNPQMMAMLQSLGGGLGQNGKNGGLGGGGVGSMQIPVSNGKDGKKGGGGNGNNGQIQGGGKSGKGGEEGKMGFNGGENKGNGGVQNGNLKNMDEGKQRGNVLSDGIQGLTNMSNGFNGMGRGGIGQLGNMPMSQMGNHMQMSQAQAMQGLPTTAMGGGSSRYLGGARPEGANPIHQQQLAAMMINQQRANGNEGFQPMIYAPPPPAVNYMPQNSYPYPYQYQYPPHGEPYVHGFSYSDENTSNCSVM